MSETSADNVKKDVFDHEIYCGVGYWSKMGHGTYGVLIRSQQDSTQLTRGFQETLPNRLHLRAAIDGLDALPPGSTAVLHSSSKYVVDGMRNHWVKGWCKRGWKTKEGNKVANQDLWQMLDDVAKDRRVKWALVTKYANNPIMEQCRTLAREALHNSFDFPYDQ